MCSLLLSILFRISLYMIGVSLRALPKFSTVCPMKDNIRTNVVPLRTCGCWMRWGGDRRKVMMMIPLPRSSYKKQYQNCSNAAKGQPRIGPADCPVEVLRRRCRDVAGRIVSRVFVLFLFCSLFNYNLYIHTWLHFAAQHQHPPKHTHTPVTTQPRG